MTDTKSGWGSRTTGRIDIERRVANVLGRTEADVSEVVRAFLSELAATLTGPNGTRVEIRRFGTFFVSERAAAVRRNPRTMEEVSVPAKRCVKFKAGSALLGRVQSPRAEGEAA